MFFERVEKACFEKKISIARLLRELKFSSSSATYWRRGSIPKIDKLIKISEYFGIPVEYFIEGGVNGVPYSSENFEKSTLASSEPAKRSGKPYFYDNTEKPSISEREIGRLEGRIEELEKKNAEYKEIIEKFASQSHNNNGKNG
ncbi:MAG: helix-turn-helix domain-containing protein [Chitinispirillia bacterium]|nr:helix-turn-helix domain-containing protein [Chitinispirillia bacterium]